MPQDVGNLLQRTPSLDQSTGHRVTQRVSAGAWQADTLASTGQKLRDSRWCDRDLIRP